MAEPGQNIKIDRPTTGMSYSVPDRIREVPEGIREEVQKEYKRLILASLRSYAESNTAIDVAMPAFLSLQEAHLDRSIEAFRLK